MASLSSWGPWNLPEFSRVGEGAGTPSPPALEKQPSGEYIEVDLQTIPEKS